MTGWLAHGSYTTVKPVYYANAVVGAAPPNEQTLYNPGGGPTPRNGLLDMGGAQLIMNLVVLGFEDPQVVERIVAAGGHRNFTVKMVPTPVSEGGAAGQPLPLIFFEATQDTADMAVKTVAAAAAQADFVLVGIQKQAGVPDSQLLHALPATQPIARPGIPSRNKGTVNLLLLGVSSAFLAGFGLDVLVRRLRNKRSRRGAPVEKSPPILEAAEQQQASQRDARL